MNNSGLHCECLSYSKNARGTNIMSFSLVTLKWKRNQGTLQLLLICKYRLFIQEQEAKTNGKQIIVLAVMEYNGNKILQTIKLNIEERR